LPGCSGSKVLGPEERAFGPAGQPTARAIERAWNLLRAPSHRLTGKFLSALGIEENQLILGCSGQNALVGIENGGAQFASTFRFGTANPQKLATVGKTPEAQLIAFLFHTDQTVSANRICCHAGSSPALERHVRRFP